MGQTELISILPLHGNLYQSVTERTLREQEKTLGNHFIC